MYPIKNNLLIKMLKGEEVERVPVWMMRQAGRYLPEYNILRDKYTFFERCKTPELACEITLQPVDIVGVDAAILFSDILVIPDAMGMEVQLIDKVGPYFPEPIKNENDLKKIRIPEVNEELKYVLDAIKLIKRELNGRVPLIGFAGSPWTILCYMVQGKGSKTFDEAKRFCFTNPKLASKLLQMITDLTIAYLKAQIEAGADVVQIFDSWGGLLSKDDFEIISLKYIKQIVEAVKDKAPVIVFSKGAWHSLDKMSKIGASALGIDWCIDAKTAREFTGNSICLQGNFDPAKLYCSRKVIEQEVDKMLTSFGNKKYIANLGHGILPTIPVEHAKIFVETVKNYQWKN